MARTPKISYWESRGGYYTQWRGKQKLLAKGPKDEPHGPTFEAARKAFGRLVPDGKKDGMDEEKDAVSVLAVISRYYASLKAEERVSTLSLAESMLDPAITAFGHLKINELQPITVSEWLTRREKWNATTRCTAIDYLNCAFNWAKGAKIITANPIDGIKKPERRVRGRNVVLPELLQNLLIDSANRQLGKLLRMLRWTGARPGEIIHADCSHYQPGIAAMVYPWNPPSGEYRWKCGKRTKRDRVIYLTDEAKSLVEGEIGIVGSRGRIFRTLRGVPWTGHNLTTCMEKLPRGKVVKEWCEANRFDAGKIMPYGFRHSYITSMLGRGCPIKLLADLCGTSVKMIEKVYSHVHDDHVAMRRLFLQFAEFPRERPSREPGD